MFDQNKRRTLKVLGVTPLMTIPVLASATNLEANKSNAAESALVELAQPNQATGMPLQIQILDTTSVPDNNVLLRNNSDEILIISRFMPGHIYFNGQIMDLNEAVGKRPLRIEAGQSKAFEFKAWPVLNAGPVEYVWADHASEVLNENTAIVNLGAFMADTSAVVYANTKAITEQALLS